MIKTDSLSILKFDSDLFHKEVALYSLTNHLQLHHLNTELKANNIDLLYVVSNTLLEKSKMERELNCSISYIDNKVTFAKHVKVNDVHHIDLDITTNQWKEKDIPQLEHLAIESGQYSRFFLDNKIDTKHAENLYRIWINKSLSFELADEVYLARNDDGISGIMTVKFNRNIATVGLLAVSAKYKGKGVAASLTKHLENRCQYKKIDVIFISTQKINQRACDFYLKVGYHLEESIFLYHCLPNP